MPDTPGLAEMDRILYAQAGLNPPWEVEPPAEPSDVSVPEPLVPVAPPVGTEPPVPPAPQAVAYVEHVPALTPQPVPPPPVPSVSIGSLRIEIVEPPPASLPAGGGVPRARAHLGSSRSPRRTWGW